MKTPIFSFMYTSSKPLEEPHNCPIDKIEIDKDWVVKPLQDVDVELIKEELIPGYSYFYYYEVYPKKLQILYE